MGALKICPECGVPLTKGKSKSLDSVIGKKSEKNNKYNICTNPNCKVAFVSNDKIIYNKDLKKELWFKNDSENAIVCFCAGVTKNEIIDATKNGCRSMKDVYKYTKKKKSSSCKDNHPFGECCKDAFNYIIKNGA